MTKEIEILLKADAKGCLVVDKDSHICLERDDLLAAKRKGLYQEQAVLLAPERQSDWSGPFPGCMQLSGASAKYLRCRMVGQTKHFVMFYPAEGPDPLRDALADRNSLE